MFNKRDLTKNIVRFIVGVGTHRIVSQIIDSNVQSRSAVDTAFIGAGSVAIGYLASDTVGDYTDRQIDKIFDLFSDIWN